MGIEAFLRGLSEKFAAAQPQWCECGHPDIGHDDRYGRMCSLPGLGSAGAGPKCPCNNLRCAHPERALPYDRNWKEKYPPQ